MQRNALKFPILSLWPFCPKTSEYLAARLAMIRQELTYPREDVWELRNRFTTLEETVKRIEEQLDPEEPFVAAGASMSAQTTNLRRLR